MFGGVCLGRVAIESCWRESTEGVTRKVKTEKNRID